MIVGKVVQIIDESLIVLNVGEVSGAKTGMRFVVFEEGDEVKDPDSGNSLGHVELVKGIVVVTHVQEHMCQATGAAEQNAATGTVLSEKMVRENIDFGALQRARKMNVAREKMYGRKSTGPINVGDGVRQLTTDES